MAELNKIDFDLKAGDIISIHPISNVGDYAFLRGKLGKITYDSGHNPFDPTKTPDRQFRYRVLFYEPMWSSLSKILVWGDNFAFCELRKANPSQKELNTLQTKQKMLMTIDGVQHLLNQDTIDLNGQGVLGAVYNKEKANG